MAATTATITIEQFRRLPENETLRYELVHGEIVEMPMAKLRHEIVKGNLNTQLARSVDETKWLLLAECGYELDRYNARIPDLSLMKRERFANLTPDDFPSGAPDLAIEVVSSESAATLEDKVELYLSTGDTSVWVVFPKSRTIRIFESNGTSRLLREGDVLESPALLPGFAMEARAVFAGV